MNSVGRGYLTILNRPQTGTDHGGRGRTHTGPENEEGRPRSPGIPSNQNPPGRLLLAGAMRAKLLYSITWLSRARVQTRILRPSGMESAGRHPTARRGPVEGVRRC